ncbi:DUF6886 family protein [Metabacillus idriensis]|uniref:DUF6886 family protein n=1 Tax=Metabacillus idriensis TaxID=324768 RepID=UPI0035BFB4A4
MLYHFSEDPSIKIFKPRQSASFPSLHPAVWAIDQEHALHYIIFRGIVQGLFIGRVKKRRKRI